MKQNPSTAYSGTPLIKKLGIKSGMELMVVNAPANYRELIDPLPDGTRFVTRLRPSTDFVHIFVTSAAELKKSLTDVREGIRPDAVIWVSWQKKQAKMQSDVTDNVVRDIALPLGLVDIKVCAVDEIWSGLKLVVRKALRKGG
jgi:hypothetical protein